MRFDLGAMEKLRLEAENAKAIAEQRALEMAKELETAQTMKAAPSIRRPTHQENMVSPEKGQSIAASDTRQSTSSAAEIPLSTLLRNYIILLAQDRRNIAVGILSVLVIMLSLRLASSPATTMPFPSESTMQALTGHNSKSSHTPSQYLQQILPSPEGDTVVISHESVHLHSAASGSLFTSTPIPTPAPASPVEPVDSPLLAGILTASH